MSSSPAFDDIDISQAFPNGHPRSLAKQSAITSTPSTKSSPAPAQASTQFAVAAHSTTMNSIRKTISGKQTTKSTNKPDAARALPITNQAASSQRKALPTTTAISKLNTQGQPDPKSGGRKQNRRLSGNSQVVPARRKAAIEDTSESASKLRAMSPQAAATWVKAEDVEANIKQEADTEHSLGAEDTHTRFAKRVKVKVVQEEVKVVRDIFYIGSSDEEDNEEAGDAPLLIGHQLNEGKSKVKINSVEDSVHDSGNNDEEDNKRPANGRVPKPRYNGKGRPKAVLDSVENSEENEAEDNESVVDARHSSRHRGHKGKGRAVFERVEHNSEDGEDHFMKEESRSSLGCSNLTAENDEITSEDDENADGDDLPGSPAAAIRKLIQPLKSVAENCSPDEVKWVKIQLAHAGTIYDIAENAELQDCIKKYFKKTQISQREQCLFDAFDEEFLSAVQQFGLLHTIALAKFYTAGNSGDSICLFDHGMGEYIKLV